jgi:hypothetical protein
VRWWPAARRYDAASRLLRGTPRTLSGKLARSSGPCGSTPTSTNRPCSAVLNRVPLGRAPPV